MILIPHAPSWRRDEVALFRKDHFRNRWRKHNMRHDFPQPLLLYTY
jgi:hypothetical protein